MAFTSMIRIQILFLVFVCTVVRAAPDAVNVNEDKLISEAPLYSACADNGKPTEIASCEIQSLNVTDPPSIYGFQNYPASWSNVICNLLNVTLQNRVNLEVELNFCKVPTRGADAFLAMSIGLLAACLLIGKFATVYILITGVALGVLNYYVNLLELGNAIAIWLSFRPGDLFLYAFLPPLIVDSALNIEMYMFKKVFVHSIMMAVVMVILTAIILTPIILFVLGFENQDWFWVYGAIFAAIIAPTDAIAVSSVLKKAHGPPILTAILEGESLLNDASGITLFEVFLEIIADIVEGDSTTVPSVWSVIPTIIKNIVKLSSIGFGIGLGFSIVSLYILRMIRWNGAGLHIEATYVLAMAYMSYYVANAPAGGSGVIAVVTFGLFGNVTSLWGMPGSSLKTGQFKAIWEMIAFAVNGLVFFWAGLSSINFLIRSFGVNAHYVMDYVSIPLIYIFMLLIRTFCIAIFNPIFKLSGRGLSLSEIFFLGWSGLRGAVSLILLTYISGSRIYLLSRNQYDENGIEIIGRPTLQDEFQSVSATVALWTSCFVVLTLIVNGPCVGPLLSILKLNKVESETLHIRSQAKAYILKQQNRLIQEGQDNESFKSADWEVVNECTDLSKALSGFGNIPDDEADQNKSKKPGGLSRCLSASKTFFVNGPRKVWGSLVGRVDRKSSEAEVSDDAVKLDTPIDAESNSNDLDRLMSECPYQSMEYDDEFFITVDIPRGEKEETSPKGQSPRRWKRAPSLKEGLDPATLREMRSRIISGIGDALKSRRQEGTMSRGAFQILQGACNEELDEPKESILIWDELLKNIEPGIFTNFISKMTLKSASTYQNHTSFWKKLLHLPVKLQGAVFMRYFSSKMLTGCEVALEYAAALNITSQVKWLEIQGENFVQLLSEIEAELEKARSFILDRELEAPGTFRAIQSYRASIVVLQGLEKCTRDLASSGMIKADECEGILEAIYKKSRRLELVGPVWKVANVHTILEQSRPFSLLPEEIFSHFWNIGTLEEYKPNSLISTGKDNSIIYVLLGVCKRTKIVDSKMIETFVTAGEASGLAGALGLAPVPGKKDMIALGNALGRGPIVFRLTRQDIDTVFDTISQENSEVRAMLKDEWIKSAAISMFADLCESDGVMDQLGRLLQHQSDEDGTSHRNDISMHPNFSGKVNMDIHEIGSQEVSHMHARQSVKRMLTRLRNHMDDCEIHHFETNDTFNIDSTVLVVRGTVICEANDKTATAPHIECWGPDFFDTVSATNSTWKVTSKDAVIFVYRRE